MSAGRLSILTYHSLDDSGSPISTSPEWFAETMQRLVEAGFVGVDLEDWIARGRPPVARGFAVTFDDGLRSILPGLETLGRLGVPASVFLVTDHVGRDNDWSGQPSWVTRAATLGWSEISELARRGVTFGSHTRTHQRLDRLTIGAVEDELRGSCEAIEAKLGRRCRLLAYPYGRSAGPVWDRCRRFDAAFGTRLATASARDNPRDLPRVEAYYLRSSRSIDRLIDGGLGPRLAARGAIRTARRVAADLVASGLR